MSVNRFLNSVQRMTVPCKDEPCRTGTVLKEGLLFYLRYVVISFLLIVVVLTISKLTGLEIKHVASTEAFRDSFRNNLPIRLFQACLLGPIMEEIVFRLWLSFKRHHLGIALFALSYVVLTKYVFPHEQEVFLWGYHSAYFEHAGLKVLISGLFSSSVIIVKEDWLTNLGVRTKHIIICISLFCFAALHLTNIICPWYLYPLMLIMCLPQFILGTTATYFRIQLGFFAGLAFHCLINVGVLLISHGKDIMSLLG